VERGWRLPEATAKPASNILLRDQHFTDDGAGSAEYPEDSPVRLDPASNPPAVCGDAGEWIVACVLLIGEILARVRAPAAQPEAVRYRDAFRRNS